MFRGRLMRSHSTDGLLRRTPSFCSSDRYGNSQTSSASNYPSGLYGYDSEFSPQYEDYYQQFSSRNGMQDAHSQRQPSKHHVTWGSMPKYSSDRDRRSNYSVSDVYGDSRYSRSHSQHRTSSESCCPIHGNSRQGQSMSSKLYRNNFERSIYDSRLYPLNTNLYSSSASRRNYPTAYYQKSSKPFADYNFRTSKNFGIPGRYSSYDYLRDPLLDLGYYTSYGSFSREQARAMLTSQSSFQRPKRPKWRRSVIGLNRLSLND